MITINQLKSEIILDKNQVRGRERLGTRDIIDSEEILRRKAAKQLGINASDIKTLEITRHSIDARKKPRLFNVYTLELGIGSREREEKLVKRCRNNNICISSTASYKFPSAGAEEMRHRPVIVGMGPAGLFCGYMLADMMSRRARKMWRNFGMAAALSQIQTYSLARAERAHSQTASSTRL